MPGQLDSPFGEPFVPVADPHQGGATTPLPGIGTPCLNTPVTQPESLSVMWRGSEFTQTVDGASPGSFDSPFNGGDPFGFGSMDQGSGGGGATNGALDSPWTGNIWEKP